MVDGGTSNIDEIERILKEEGESLRPHQLEGLQVLWEWNKLKRGGIVADEMGLGKTCTSVVHLWRLYRDGGGPFVVVSPLSVMNHWKLEIKRFSCGDLEPICFMGQKEERRQILDSIDNGLKKNQVLILPYHLLTNDQEDLSPLMKRTKFSLIVADEAHTLKNHKAQITVLMREIDSLFILLTGTPIQNDIGELYSLLSFCHPTKFPIEDIKEFIDKFKRNDKLDELRDILKTYSIRRKKEIVCDSIPPLQQVIFYHGLTEKQKKIYINILVKNREAITLNRNFSLVTQLMHLRKAVSHPYLFPGQEPEPFTEGEHIVQASEKMKVLDSLLSFLSRNGHKCLIFSQFTSFLDIIQDFLNLRGHSYERLDGSARAEERFTSINSFQGNEVDIFLLSTKAGGVGLTLTAADTVIFLDNDWNPQNDIQAMARCHRIGQTKPVRVIRLIGRYTVEQMMYVRAMNKLKLTDKLTDEENVKPCATDVSKMLEHGLANLRNAEDDDAVTDEQFEKIIGRTDKNGKWMNIEEEEKENEDTIVEENDKDVDEKDYFYFEGVRYKVDENDKKAMKEVLGEKGNIVLDNKKWTKEELEEMNRQKEERNKKRKESAYLKKMKKWKDAGYESMNLPLIEETSIDIDEEEEKEVEEISFITGDLMKPYDDGRKAIIVHVVDDSGSFGSGGLFTALDNLSEVIRESYETAGEMGDLSLGDTHLIRIPYNDNILVALIVAQKRKKRDELQLESLSKGLRRLSLYGKKNELSIHVSRMTHSITNITWYTVEKTLKKEIALQGIPLYVYYKPKRGGNIKNENKRIRQNVIDDNDDIEIIVDSPVKKERKRRRIIIDSDEDDENPCCSKNYEREENNEIMKEDNSEVKKKRVNLLGFLTGSIFYLSPSVRYLKDKIESEGGEVVTDPMTLYDVTHAIIPSSEREKEELVISLLPVGSSLREKEYIEKCFELNSLLI